VDARYPPELTQKSEVFQDLDWFLATVIRAEQNHPVADILKLHPWQTLLMPKASHRLSGMELP
jgi:hypothetical protein